MDIRRSTGRNATALDQAMIDYGNNYAEIFNTRLSSWRSDKIVAKIVDAYRTGYPASVVTEEEIVSTLAGSKLELQRNSRNITITVRSKSPALAAALANAYAQAIEALTDEENKNRCDKAVQQLHGSVESKRREVEDITAQLLASRTTNRVDQLRARREMVQQTIVKMTQDINELETEVTQLTEWERMLTAVKQNPENFGVLSSGAPRAQEIASEYRAYLDATNEYAKLILTYTDNHPEVISKSMEVENARKRFVDAAAKALESGSASLSVAVTTRPAGSSSSPMAYSVFVGGVVTAMAVTVGSGAGAGQGSLSSAGIAI